MLLTKLLLLPCAVASSLTLYISSVPPTPNSLTHDSPIPSPIPLAQIAYDTTTSTAELVSYTPPTGAYTRDHLLRIGLGDAKTGHWRGVLTSAASFDAQWKKKFTVHVDEKGEVYHVGFGTSARNTEGGEGEGAEVEVEVVKRAQGPKPFLNKPVVLNAEGKVGGEEPEKTFFQKYWWALALFLVVQVVAGGGKE